MLKLLELVKKNNMNYKNDAPRYSDDIISILVPTRGRPKNMQTLLDSIKDTSRNFNQVEIIFYIDNDDRDSIDKIKNLVKQYGENIKYTIGQRIVLSQMWNKCFDLASGNIFMHCGDDIIFKSNNWDDLIKNAFKKYDDKIVLVYGRDGNHDERLSTHAFLHRNWVDCVGYLVPPYFSSDWNDVWLFDVSGMINRRKYLKDVFTEHMHPHIGKADFDKTHQEREERGLKDNVKKIYKSHSSNRKKDAFKLLNFINNNSASNQKKLKNKLYRLKNKLRIYFYKEFK